MDRGERRHQLERWKRRVEGYYGGHGRGDARVVGRHARTRTPCSCYMCGNPRRRHGAATRAEHVAEVAEREQRRELGLDRAGRARRWRGWW